MKEHIEIGRRQSRRNSQHTALSSHKTYSHRNLYKCLISDANIQLANSTGTLTIQIDWVFSFTFEQIIA